MIKKKYFGTDGIRGRSGTLPITPDFMLRLGYAAGKIFTAEHAFKAVTLQASKQKKSNCEKYSRPTVLIGKDTRISGYMIEAALEAGFAAAGVDVMLCGPMPTPGVAYLTRALRLTAGVVISASHNPYHDNGIKFFSSTGDKLADDIELKIENILTEELICAAPEFLGRAQRLDDAQGRYIEFCKSTFPNDMNLHGMKLVVDCANGAAYHIAPHVLHELGAEVISIGTEPNGLNINDAVGVMAPKALQAKVLSTKADLGIALDGDADRVQIIDSDGTIYDGDQLLYILALDRLAMGQVVPGVVGTLMTNKAIELAIERHGIKFLRTHVGDRHVLEALRQKQWLLGAESSGHILCLDKHSTGDGIVSCLQVLAAIRRTDKTGGKILSQLMNGIKLYPQVCMNLAIPNSYYWQEDTVLQRNMIKLEQSLGKDGRVLVRASGTEAMLRVMVESHDVTQAKLSAQNLVRSIKKKLQLTICESIN